VVAGPSAFTGIWDEAMLFEYTRPVAAGYFQCDMATNLIKRDVARQASFLYVSSGRGNWTLGSLEFPVRRGDFIAVPAGTKITAQLDESRPLGYYYCHFELPEGAPAELSLAWPWSLSLSQKSAPLRPYASGEFRPEVAAHFRALQYELERNTGDSRLAANAHLMLLGATFCRMLAAGNQAVPAGKGLPEPVACAVDYILSHLDKSLSLAELARVACCSERRLVDLFRASLGAPPMAYVRQRRVQEAQRLLMDSVPIKDVASRLNFADSHHFSRVFRQTTGISPSEFVAGEAPVRVPSSGHFASVAAGS
jgi:AraC-like DNA-binding protein